MNTRTALGVSLVALLLAGCETPTSQRYAVAAENVQALRAIGATGVAVGGFASPADFSAMCRGLGPLQVADGLSHTAYLEKAFADELKIAGSYAAGTPRVVLSGVVHKLEFSSMRALVGGSWSIAITVRSSNGQQVSVEEHYEFSSGFAANEACRNTADAFPRAVQNIIGKTLRHPNFAALLQ